MEIKGQIYAIKSHQTDLIYIGSTIQQLSRRLSSHKTHYKNYIAGNYHFVSSFDIIKFEDCYIVLIEDYPCENKEQLTRREGEIIKENNNCVNKQIAGRTRQEFREDNKEKIKEYDKEYREDNKEKIKEYRQNNKEYYKEYQKEYNKQKITCDCGSVFRIIEKSRHLRTKKHLDTLN